MPEGWKWTPSDDLWAKPEPLISPEQWDAAVQADAAGDPPVVLGFDGAKSGDVFIGPGVSDPTAPTLVDITGPGWTRIGTASGVSWSAPTSSPLDDFRAAREKWLNTAPPPEPIIPPFTLHRNAPCSFQVWGLDEPEDDGDDELTVGVPAARTFLIDADGWLRPVGYQFQADTWKTVDARFGCHWHTDRPARDCGCGLYSFASVQETFRQYPHKAWKCLGVVEPHGKALAGAMGKRTSAATILALWVRDPEVRALVEANYPDVPVYAEPEDLLTEFGEFVDDGTGTDYWHGDPPKRVGDVLVHIVPNLTAFADQLQRAMAVIGKSVVELADLMRAAGFTVPESQPAPESYLDAVQAAVERKAKRPNTPPMWAVRADGRRR